MDKQTELLYQYGAAWRVSVLTRNKNCRPTAQNNAAFLFLVDIIFRTYVNIGFSLHRASLPSDQTCLDLLTVTFKISII